MLCAGSARGTALCGGALHLRASCVISLLNPPPPPPIPARQSWIWGLFVLFPVKFTPPPLLPGNAGSGASPSPPAFPSPGTAQGHNAARLKHKVMCHWPDEQKPFPRYLFMDLGRVPGEEEPLCVQVSHPPGRSGRGSSRGAAGQPAGSLIIARHLHIEIAEQRMIN